MQKLDLYQIIAYAEEGDTKNVISRARQMLTDAKAEPLALSAEQMAQIDKILMSARESVAGLAA